MAGEPMSYWEYVKAAFWKPVRTRILGSYRIGAHKAPPRPLIIERIAAE